MGKSASVYCSSSQAVAPHFLELSQRLGSLLAQGGYRLVYGGANIGCMGALAAAVHAAGGEVTGVIPEYLAGKGLDYAEADELIVTRTMGERKALMEELGDLYIVLPGGFGTLEELIEVITLKQLHYHRKPIVLVNYKGFYDPLLEVFQHFVTGRFARAESLALYHVVNDVDEVLPCLESYSYEPPDDKWI